MLAQLAIRFLLFGFSFRRMQDHVEQFQAHCFSSAVGVVAGKGSFFFQVSHPETGPDLTVFRGWHSNFPMYGLTLAPANSTWDVIHTPCAAIGFAAVYTSPGPVGHGFSPW